MALMNSRPAPASDSARRVATTSVAGCRPLIHSTIGHESRTRVFKFALLFSEVGEIFLYVAPGTLKLLPGGSLGKDNLLPADFQGQLGALSEVEGIPNLLRDGDLALGRDGNFIHRCILPQVRRIWGNSSLQFRCCEWDEPPDARRGTNENPHSRSLRALEWGTQPIDFSFWGRITWATRLRTIPWLGPIRVALLLGRVQTPHRFRSKRQFWAYCGLGLETRSSADYGFVNGQLERRSKPVFIRGLNLNHNHDLKNLFKSAATGASSSEGAFREFYEKLLVKGMKPEMARLTLARKIAAITLHVWKKGEPFDAEYLKSQAA